MDGDDESFVNLVCTRKLGLNSKASLTTFASCGKGDLSLKNKNVWEVISEADNCDTNGFDFSDNYYLDVITDSVQPR
jgi:hypothetical protein